MRFRSTAPLRLRGRVFSKLKLEALEARTLLSAGFWDGFASNPQHTAISTVASQPLETIRWQAPIDLAPFETAHYGTPMATAADTIIFPVRTSSSDTFRVEARSGIDGSLLWSQDSGFVMPPHAWLPEFPATLTPSGRLYFADANGVVDYRDNPDAPSGPTGSIQFYAGAPDSTVCIDTPITSDSHGNIYFGFRLNGTSPTFGFSDGLARIDASGHGSYVLARTASGDLLGIFVSENCAPALSHDESTVYFAVGAFTHGYLVGVDATTLTPRYSVLLHDPRNGNANTAGVVDNSTASPTIGPDGTVFFGVLGNPFNGSRGWLLHFSADLATEYAPGAFGWDDTAAIVPTRWCPLIPARRAT